MCCTWEDKFTQKEGDKHVGDNKFHKKTEERESGFLDKGTRPDK